MKKIENNSQNNEYLEINYDKIWEQGDNLGFSLISSKYKIVS